MIRQMLTGVRNLYFFRFGLPSSSPSQPLQSLRKLSGASSILSEDDLVTLLEQPSWSMNSLLDVPSHAKSQSTISQQQLHRLLRLSALPLPTSADEEAKMLNTLSSQLNFVRVIQLVDTTGVQPLQNIRDETTQAKRETEINLDCLKEELNNEEIIGPSRRIKGKRATPVNNQTVQDPDLLAHAPKKLGRYIVVDTKKQ